MWFCGGRGCGIFPPNHSAAAATVRQHQFITWCAVAVSYRMLAIFSWEKRTWSFADTRLPSLRPQIFVWAYSKLENSIATTTLQQCGICSHIVPQSLDLLGDQSGIRAKLRAVLVDPEISEPSPSLPQGSRKSPSSWSLRSTRRTTRCSTASPPWTRSCTRQLSCRKLASGAHGFDDAGRNQ